MGLLDVFKKDKEITEQEKERKEEKKTKEAKIKLPSSGKKRKIEPKKEKKIKEKHIEKTDVLKTKKEERVSGTIPPVEKSEIKGKKEKKQVSKIAYRILSSPHITEKATDLSEKNKYIFKVSHKANKIEIKKAIKDVYGVNVIDVKIINVHRKKRKLGKQTGWKKGYKKAIIRVEEGQKIELLSR